MTSAILELRRTAGRVRDQLASPRFIDGTMLALGGVTGLFTGLLAALLIATVRSVQRLAFGSEVGVLDLLIVPTLGAFAVGLLVHYWAREPSGSGIVRIMEIIAMRGGRAPKRTPAAGLAATGLALGTGASGGREAPIVLIGGSVGSLLGQSFGLDEDRLRSLIAAGAAAGIGASFNAPIGGMLFAIEVIVGGLRSRSLQVIVVASVVGSVTARQLIGEGLIYRPAGTYELGDPRELLLYALLGLAAAGIGLAFLTSEGTVFRWAAQLRARVWPPLVLALGGLGVGILALAVPEVLGSGDNLPAIDGIRQPIQAMIDGTFDAGWTAVGTLVGLLVAKFAATLLSVGSGNAVGTFAPSLFMGAALGGALGTAAATVLPNAGLQPGAYALVGMAAVFAATGRAPLTAVLIVFELTGDYGLVLPLMLAAGLATFLADRVTPDSVYTRPLRQRGIVYAQPEDVDIMQTVRVDEVMSTDHPTVSPSTTVPELRAVLTSTRSHGFAVVDGEGRLVGVVALSDLARADEHPDVRAGLRTADELTVGDICTERVLLVHPEDPVYRALHRMAAIDVGRIPVATSRGQRFVGIVRRADVVRAYQQAIARGLSTQQHVESRRLRDLAGVRFVEYVVDPLSAAAGRAVREIAWPSRTVLTSIRRGSEVVMPDGDTVLQPGDEVVVLTALEHTDEVRDLIGRRSTSPTTRDPREPR